MESDTKQEKSTGRTSDGDKQTKPLKTAEIRDDGISELVYLVLLNDHDAFIHLTNRMQPIIRNVYARFSLAAFLDLNEWICIAQEQLYHAVLYYRQDAKTSFITHYYTVLNNKARDLCRRFNAGCRNHMTAVSLDYCSLEGSTPYSELLPDQKQNVHEQVMNTLLLEQVKQVLKANLKPEQYEVIELFLKGKTSAEIARSIGRSKSFVQRVMTRARELCRCIDTPFR